MPRPWHQSRPPTSRRGRVAEGIAVDPTAAATRGLGHVNPAIYVPMQGPSELGLSGTLEDWDRSRDLAGIDVPALVIGATHDTMDPEHMRWMAEQLPQRRYLHCPDGSHLSQFDDPQHYFPGLLDFLRSLRPLPASTASPVHRLLPGSPKVRPSRATDPRGEGRHRPPRTGRRRTMRKLVTGVALGAGLVGGALGTVVVAPAFASTVPGGPAEAVTERVERIKDALEGLVSDGTLDQSQADDVAETLGQSRLGLGGQHGPGHLGPERVADVLGISTDALRAAAREGRTLAELAEDEGISRADLVDRLVAAAEAALDDEVAEGDLTQAEADALRDRLTDRVTARVDEPLGTGGHGHRGFGRDGERPHRDGRAFASGEGPVGRR